MNKKQLEQQRERLRSHLEAIMEISNSIQEEMESVPHPRGMAHRSLKPKSGQYIVESESGFSATYQDSEGDSYRIEIYRVN